MPAEQNICVTSLYRTGRGRCCKEFKDDIGIKRVTWRTRRVYNARDVAVMYVTRIRHTRRDRDVRNADTTHTTGQRRTQRGYDARVVRDGVMTYVTRV